MNYNNSNVRRQDRLLDENSACRILKDGEYGYLSMLKVDGTPYGIPISYVWNGKNIIYLHCAPEGTKLESIKQNPLVSFCVVGHTHVIPRQFTTEYESIVLSCNASVGLDEQERKEALRLLISKYAPDDVELGMMYAARSFHRTEIIRLVIQEWSGKSKAVHKSI